MKELLVSAPILSYANSDLPYELHTDASGTALGSVLYQEQDGVKKVISYASRGLTKSEKRYPPHKLEFLALKWAVCDKYKDYLYGSNFSVLTDNNPMTYVLTSAKLDATGHRWLAALAAFNFTIQYRPGKKNGDADGLSRIPQSAEMDNSDDRRETISIESVQAICNSTLPKAYIESLAVDPDVLPLHDDEASSDTIIDWAKAQDMDPIISPMAKYVKDGRKPTVAEVGPTPLLRQFCHLRLKDGVLYREVTISDDRKLQLVLPSAHTNIVLEALHNDMGHPGKDRTLSLLRDRFYWPGMDKDVEEWIEQCGRCIRRKTPANQRAPLVSITTQFPLELVCMDFLTLEQSKGGHQNILVITDHFTRYAQAIPTRNQTARTTAQALFDNFIVHYGIPQRIHSDQGANFGSKVVKELCNLTGMKKSRTTSYHPMGNGMCERFNRTLLGMLGTLEPHQKANWKAYVAPMVHAYNCTRHESTGVAPYFLMFGRHPRLPIDLAFGIRKTNSQSTGKYVKDLRERLSHAYQLAAEASRNAQARQKEGYDTKIRGASIQQGDRVLVKRVAFDGKHKLADTWEDTPYVVLEQPNPEIPVFTVVREDGEGRTRNLHRNLLLPVGFIREPDTTEQPIRPTPRPRTRQQKSKEAAANRSTSEESADDPDSSDESEVGYVLRPADSESTLTEVPAADDESAHDVSVLSGDAQPEDTQGEEAETGSTGSASDTAEAAIPEPEPVMEAEPPQVADRPPVPVRRSGRERRAPAWFTSGQYDMSKAAVQQTSDQNIIQLPTPEWQQKADYLSSLSNTPLFTGIEREAARAIIDLVCHH